MRRRAGSILWVSLAVTLIAGTMTASQYTAAASTGDGGSFVPVAPTRIGDTSNGVGFGATGSFAAGATKQMKVTGVAGIPTTNVGAVIVDVAGSSTADSRLYVYPSDESRNLAAVSLDGGAGWDSTTFVVRPGPDGRIKVFNELGTTAVNVDVQGYFTETSTDATTGGFVPIKPLRIVDSANDLGISTKLSGGTTYTFGAGGVENIPETAIGVFASLRVQNATDDGGLRAVASNRTPSSSTPSVLNYGSGDRFDTGAVIDLGGDGKFKLWASAGTSVDVIVDIQGYFTAGTGGASFHPLSNTRVWDSTSSALGALGPGEKRTVELTGQGGVPGDEVGSLALGITVKGWSGNGSISVYNADLADANGTANVSYSGPNDGGVAKQATSFVDLNGNGEVTIANNTTTGDVTVLLNAQGWFDVEHENPGVTDLDAMEALPCVGSAECAPALVSGLAEGDVIDVSVSASLAASEAADLAAGVEHDLVDLPAATVSTDGHEFTVRIDPDDVPASVVQPDGIVSLFLDVETPQGVTPITAQARVVKQEAAASEVAWADPAGWNADTQGHSTTPPAGRITARNVATTYTLSPDEAELNPEVDGAKVAVGGPMMAGDVQPLSSRPGRCNTFWLDAYKEPKATLAATYPANDATGKFTLSSSTGTNYGATVSVDNNVWRASASADYFEEGGFEKGFTASKKQQKYTTVVVYRKRKKDCTNNKFDTWYYVPIEDKGRFLTASAKRPNYTNCELQSSGHFTRSSSRGKAYELAGGVKLGPWLGVDARVKRQWNGSQFIRYDNPKRSLFCGNNANAIRAGSVMMKTP